MGSCQCKEECSEPNQIILDKTNRENSRTKGLKTKNEEEIVLFKLGVLFLFELFNQARNLKQSIMFGQTARIKKIILLEKLKLWISQIKMIQISPIKEKGNNKFKEFEYRVIVKR